MEKNDNERVRGVCRGVIPSLPAAEDHNLDSRLSQSIGSKVEWTKEKIARSNGYTSPSKHKLTNEKLINEGKSKSKKLVDDNKCPWVVLVSKIKNLDTWQIPIRAIQEQLQQKYELVVSQRKGFGAKQEVEKKFRFDYTHQYKMLRDYIMELQQVNPNTTVKIHVQSEADHQVTTRVFKRIYVCLGPLKAGFKAVMRDFLGLYGAFMKGPYPGQLLTAINVDPNNGKFPLDYGIVET
ncbi:hypothetical protein Tco_0516074 [Tanacetum coccineum]